MEINRDHRDAGLLGDAHRAGLKGKLSLTQGLDQARRANRHGLPLLQQRYGVVDRDLDETPAEGELLQEGKREDERMHEQPRRSADLAEEEHIPIADVITAE